MKLLFACVFGLFFYHLSAQHVSDTKQIFHKIDSQMIANPAKARDLIGFVKKNNQNKEVLNECSRLMVQAYYYENNYNEALQEIIQTENQQNVDGIIAYQSILYSAGIKNVDFNANYSENALFKINREILASNDLILQGSIAKAIQKTEGILPKITNENKHNYRDSFSFILVNLSENNRLSQFPGFHQSVLKIFSLYPDDLEFNILKKKLFPEIISDQWLLKTGNIIENTSNFRLKTLYYSFLQDYYFSKKDVSHYSLISQKKENQVSQGNKAITEARSQWIYLTETKTVDEYNFAEKRGLIILSAIVFLSCMILMVLFFKIRQEKLKGKNYQLFSDKLKTNARKKKEPQVISENVKLALLEKLEKLESTNFYLDPHISIQNLAKKLDSNSKYVSDIINTYKKKNFTAYINEMRIDYIKQKLNTETVYRSYKIKYLAEESGFSSHSVFSSVFKSIEGISPAQYIQNLNH